MSGAREAQGALHKQLLAIRKAAKGDLTPQAVVDTARDESHPLHGRFEWDDSVAGEAYRRSQAAELIRSVKVTYSEAPDGEPRRIRAFSSLNVAVSPDQRGYAPTEELVENELTRKILLRQCERDIAALRRKYGHLEEFAALVTAKALAS